MKILLVTLATAGALAAGIAFAAESGADVLKAKGCTNCHEADKKKVGPSFKDSAARGVKPDDVVAKMKEGKGHPKLAKPDAELKKAVETALSTK